MPVTMKNPSDCILFTVGGSGYSLGDLIVAAKLWGDWDDVEKEARQVIACLKWIEEEKGEDVDDAETESAANEFRYARDLITTEETETWLNQWELSVEEWMGYLRRSLLRSKLGSQLDEIEARHPPSQEEVESCVHVEAICSGGLGRFAKKLAARASANQRALEEHWLDKAGVSDPGKSLERLEAAYETFCQKLVTHEGIENQVKSHQLDWIRLDCTYVSFPTEDMAREAVLCIREDAMTPEQVARNARTEVHTGRLYLDEIDPELWNPFLAAQTGALVGPIRWDDGFALFLVRDKVSPSADDQEIRQRGEQALLSALLEREMIKRVTWHKRL